MKNNEIISALHSVLTYTDEDYGYQRYVRREMFEKIILGQLDFNFCDCCPVDDALKDIYDVLVFASLVDETSRFLYLHRTFKIGDVHKNSMLTVLFQMLTSEGLITQIDTDDFNSSCITELGEVFLECLVGYLDLESVVVY